MPHPDLTGAPLMGWLGLARAAKLKAGPVQRAAFEREIAHAMRLLAEEAASKPTPQQAKAPPQLPIMAGINRLARSAREAEEVMVDVGRARPSESRPFIHKRLIGGLTGLITGGPLAGLAGLARGGGGGTAVTAGPVTNFQGCASGFTRNQAGQCVAMVQLPGIRARAERALPFGATGLETVFQAEAGCPSGFHPNKSDYWTSTGFVGRGSRCVRNRRRNNLNQAAIRRSVARVGGFVREVKKVDKMLRKIAPRK